MSQRLAQLSAFANGIFTGAMLLIALGLVSFWKGIDAPDFQAWFAEHAFRIGRVMIPLGAVALAASAAAWWTSHRSASAARTSLGVAALGVAGVALTYGLFVHPINAQLLADAPVDAGALLARWELWHWVRVALGALATAAAIHACAVAAPRDAGA